MSRGDEQIWYLAHHGVYHPKKTNKIRVVFDCSAVYWGICLNNLLLQGPDLTNSLIGVLTRFREYPVAFIGYIEAMFYQVQVPEAQRDFLRFLWWPNGDLSCTPAEYRMTVHLFGAASSPSISNYALRKTAEATEEEFGSEITSTITKNFYVDDCLKSVLNEKTAVEMINKLRSACMKGGFRLTKFMSNRCDVLQSLPEEERCKDLQDVILEEDNLPVERALGVLESMVCKI